MNLNYLNNTSKIKSADVTVLKMQHKYMINYNYLVVDPITRQSVIIDPAWQMDKIENALIKTCSELKGILLTHSHPDHIHLAKPLAKKYNCPIWMSHEEIKYSGFDDEQLVAIGKEAWFVGQMKIEPILTPGHTPGCVCYHIEDNLFTGDVLFAEGCGMCPDELAAHAMYDSLKHLKMMLAPDTRIYPGHSYGRQPGRVFSKVLQENIYLQFRDEHSFAAFRLRSGQNKKKFINFR